MATVLGLNRMHNFMYRALVPQSMKQNRLDHARFAYDKTEKQVNDKVDHLDFVSYMLKNNDKNRMADDELRENAAILIVAGSESVNVKLLSSALALTQILLQQRLEASTPSHTLYLEPKKSSKKLTLLSADRDTSGWTCMARFAQCKHPFKVANRDQIRFYLPSRYKHDEY